MPAPSGPRQPPSVQRGWRRMLSAAAGRSGPHGPYAGAGGPGAAHGGAAPPRAGRLSAGDVVEIEAEGIGVLRNPVVGA